MPAVYFFDRSPSFHAVPRISEGVVWTGTGALFIEDINEALREIVRFLGGEKNGYKVVGVKLWPEKTPEAAGQHLANCLNVHRAERLNPEQVWLLFVWARQAGFHNAKRWFDESTGYLPGAPIEPEEEKAQIQRAFIESVQVQKQLMARWERLESAPLKAVAR